VDKIPTFKEFNQIRFINETHQLVKSHMSHAELSELIGEGFFDFIKGVFTNPIQKRKLDKFGKDLLKTKIELMKLEIEEDNIESFKSQLDQQSRNSRNDNNYKTSSAKIDIADKAKATKIKSLQDREEALIDQMDQIGKESEKLQKYVDKVKFQIRIKANDATIRIADGEVERILKDLKTDDVNTVKKLDKEIKKY
jgi:uncharacterized FlaG/YvyC family protein